MPKATTKKKSSAMEVDEPSLARRVLPILGTVAAIGGAAALISRLVDEGVISLDGVLRAADAVDPDTGQAMRRVGGVVRDAVTGELRSQVNTEFTMRDMQAAQLQAYVGELEQALHQAQYQNDLARQHMAQQVLAEVQLALANQAQPSAATLQQANQVILDADTQQSWLEPRAWGWEYAPFDLSGGTEPPSKRVRTL